MKASQSDEQSMAGTRSPRALLKAFRMGDTAKPRARRDQRALRSSLSGRRRSMLAMAAGTRDLRVRAEAAYEGRSTALGLQPEASRAELAVACM